MIAPGMPAKAHVSPRDVFLDVAPLFESEWTGIPVVTAQLAKHGRLDESRKWHFLYNNQIVNPTAVDEILRTKTGRWHETRLLSLLWSAPLPSFAQMKSSIAIFPNVKSYRGAFWKEAMIVHDLSTLLTPQFHHGDTVAHHANRLRDDVESSDRMFCVSRATAGDLESYFPAARNKVTVTPLGVDWALRTRVGAHELLENMRLEKFVLTLGTVEPRKNISIVIDFIMNNPSVLNEYTFVFAGRDGWLDERANLESKLSALGIPSHKVVFTGFLSDALKLALLMRAEFTIFASFFEGFGLPVAESLSVGCPVLCSQSSSLTEVIDFSCVTFDPLDSASFASAFADISKRGRRRERREAEDLLNFNISSALDWRRFIKPIEDWLVEMDSAWPA